MAKKRGSNAHGGTIRVLVADDHAIVREGLRVILQKHDDVEIVGEAADGNEAISKASELQPDVVLMDVSMPGTDGYEATRELSVAEPEVKVVLLTMHDDKRHVLPGLRAGAAGYVVKNGESEDLLRAIRAVAEGRGFLHPSIANLVMDDMRNGKSREVPAYGAGALTKREWEVLKLVARGHTSREIADKLYISVKTVETHRERIMLKLDLQSRSELVEFAIDQGLMTRDN